MAQTAFILVLTPDEAAGQRLREILREKYGHVCSVVTSLPAALDSIRARAPDVVVAPPGSDQSAAVGPLAELLDGVARDATLLVRGAVNLPPVRHIHITTLDGVDRPSMSRANRRWPAMATGC